MLTVPFSHLPKMSETLFQPLKLGPLTLSHRVAMAPLTRFRADENNVPVLPIVKEYYEQRASVPGTLIITEATFISQKAGGYAHVPGIWSDDQVRAWKEVTDAVRAKGSFIFLQLWALGRLAKPDVLQKTGHRVVSSSPMALGPDQPAPHPLSESEIQEYIADYVHASKNAIAAGFHGVQLHGANGYLPDQFLQDIVNQRTDRWGGSIENRSRFHLDITRAIIAAVGKERVGVRLNPFTIFQPGGVKLKDPVPQFTHLIKELKALDIAFLDLIEPRVAGTGPVDGIYSAQGDLDFAVEAWGKEKPVLIAGGLTAGKAKELVDERYAGFQVVAAFGRFFISTPDLPFRIQKGIAPNAYDRPTFYTQGPKGYIDYPFSTEFTAFSKI
jgi:NADPH2 dehydrogenase